jgi:predicted nuclease of predicted toxin-antitoxin system
MANPSLRFLVDVGVGKKVENWLSEHGYDVQSVRALNPRMPDQEILQIAVTEARMVVTMDKDFGEMIYRSGLAHHGVLLLRCEAATGEEKARIVAKILMQYADKLMNKFCVYLNGKLRIRDV